MYYNNIKIENFKKIILLIICQTKLMKLFLNFNVYCMELFDQKKKLIQSKNFESKQGTYYYIKNNSEYFVIKSDDFLNLYYYNLFLYLNS